METEDVFLTFACLLLFFDLIQLSKVKPNEKNKLEYGFYASTFACGLVAASYLILVHAFLKDNFILSSVYSYSSSNLPTQYKFYATWAGMSGSMLFLSFLTAILYFAYRFTRYEKGGAFYIAVYRVMDFILISFLLITLMSSPFERMAETPMDGRGLNPLLQTFWMLIHPPVVFLGYVLVILAFALTLAGMSNGKGEDRGILRLALQAAWLLLSLGIALGGLWAYEVLGWGGYWAWDPVETASLLPWFTLTTYFHLAPSSDRNLTKELMTLITLLAVVFTTALTRGGLLVSVHAFGVSPIGPALLFFNLCMTAYFFHLSRKIRKPLYTIEVKKSSLFSISLFVGHWSLIILTLISFWGIAFPLIVGIFQEIPPSTDIGYYNTWSFPFTLVFVAALIGCNAPGKLGLRGYAVSVLGSLGAGLALALLGRPTPSFMANLGLPLLILALIVIGYNLTRHLQEIRKSYLLVGRGLIHLGVIVILIGVFISSTTVRESGDIVARPNTTIEALGLNIELQNFTVYEGAGRVHVEGRCYSEYSSIKMDVVIDHNGVAYDRNLWISLYTTSGILCKPLIIRTWTEDLYIHMHHTQSIYHSLVVALAGQTLPPDNLVINVRRIPSVNIVWAGVTLLSIGMAMPLIMGFKKLTK